MYYELLACTGILGIVSMLVPLVKLFFRFHKLSSDDSRIRDERLIARLMSWSILLILVTGISQVYIYYTFFYIYIAIWISAYGIISNKEKQNNESEQYLRSPGG